MEKILDLKYNGFEIRFHVNYETFTSYYSYNSENFKYLYEIIIKIDDEIGYYTQIPAEIVINDKYIIYLSAIGGVDWFCITRPLYTDKIYNNILNILDVLKHNGCKIKFENSEDRRIRRIIKEELKKNKKNY